MKHPPWLKVKAADPEKIKEMEAVLRQGSLHTICESAICPNLGECFSRKTATFLIMGNVCTRNCRFCAVNSGIPGPLDETEPRQLAQTVEALGLDYVVLTSVTRDDLPDGGASHFARCLQEVRSQVPGINMEVLVPDFQGSVAAISTVLAAAPHVFNHNLETVERLYEYVRPGASYDRSLEVLERAKKVRPQTLTKTGLMLGLGETREEVLEVMRNLRAIRCDILTLGQYLAPSANHAPIARFVEPREFAEYKNLGMEMGFQYVASGPLVRSSYQARKALLGD